MLNRRNFSQAIALGAAAAALPAWAFTEGKEYSRLAKPVSTQAKAGEIEVVEFFAYSCIHCYRFEPILKEWRATLPANVIVRQLPVQFSPAFEPLAKTFFAFETLGWLETLHNRLFAAIHVEKKRIYDEAAIMQWVASQGVDTRAFQKAYASFGAASNARRATQVANSYQVEGTPALGIHGQFLIPGQGQRTVQIANELIQRVA